MKKVMVIGSPGAGKSTFARKLRDATGLPLFYLDMIWHKPDQTNVSVEEFDRRLGEIVEKDQWIIDGNYQRTMEVRLKVCDTVFLLDYPLECCLSGAEARIGRKREDSVSVQRAIRSETLRLRVCFVTFAPCTSSTRRSSALQNAQFSRYEACCPLYSDAMPWTGTEFEEEFRQWILDFPEKQLPQIYKMLEQYGEMKKVVIFHTREEADLYLQQRNF